MKKFIFGAVFGYTVSGLQMAYHDKALHRFWHVIKYVWANPDNLVNLQEAFRYVTYNNAPYPESMISDLQKKEWAEADLNEAAAGLLRIRAMHDEGYSHAEIAEALEIPENIVQLGVEGDNQFYRVTLSKNQHELIEMALRQLSAGDPESEAENEATLKAFLETTEEIR